MGSDLLLEPRLCTAIYFQKAVMPWNYRLLYSVDTRPYDLALRRLFLIMQRAVSTLLQE